MIKNIFIPEKIGNNLLFGKRIVGIDMQKHFVFATSVWAKGTKQTVEKFISLPVEHDDTTIDPHIKPLIEIKKMFGNVTYRTHIQSNNVFYKELAFPFIEHEKIKLIIKYEIESLLPFNSTDAIIDFIITHVDTETKHAKVMAACVQKEYIASHLALYVSAGIAPEAISVDLFGIYGLYHQFAEKNGDGNAILLDIGMSSTKICFITQGTFKMVRVLHQGLNHALKKAAKGQSESSLQEFFETLIRFGINQPNRDETTDNFKAAFKIIIDPLVFTITSYQTKLQNPVSHTIILYGQAGRIGGLTEYLQEQVKIPVQSFILYPKKEIEIPQDCIKPEALYSLATALIHPNNEKFNLLKDNFLVKNNRLLLQQLTTIVALTTFLISTLVFIHVTETKKMAQELAHSTEEVISTLKQQFPKIPKEETNLDEIVDQAERAIAAEKELWGAFSYANQSRYLHYLLELTEKIDKDALGFEPEKLSISEGMLTLKAKVKDYEALKQLERELKTSKLFSNIPPQDNPQFTLTINLSATEKEAS